MPLRDHQPITIDKFNGLYSRGDKDTIPNDHFYDGDNFAFVGDGSVLTRPGVGISQTVAVPLTDIKRIYNYPTQTANTLIILALDPGSGNPAIFHQINATTIFGPLLIIAGMEDFAFVPFAGRAYISPFVNYTNGDLTFQKGMASQFVYVYAGDGTPARKAAGVGMTGTMTVFNGAAGHTDPGLHIFGFVSETSSGYLTPPSILTTFTTAAGFSVSFSSIPTSGDPNVIARHLVASAVIPTFNGDLTGYPLFFVPGGDINDNVTTVLTDISFYDADLLEDASHLFDNFTEIPAGAVLSNYHNRLLVAATDTDISLALVSQPGEPEAINQINGLIIVPLDGNPITNAQELRDVLYITKRSRTVSYVDNGDDPSTWPLIVVDNALGTSVHGIATVLDSGSSSVDYLLVCTYQGISMFNGRYMSPELSWKIETFWKAQDRNSFGKIQIINAPIQKEIYVVLPDRTVLMGNYANGMDPKYMRWAPWSFVMGVNTVAVHNIDEIILGTDLI